MTEEGVATASDIIAGLLAEGRLLVDAGDLDRAEHLIMSARSMAAREFGERSAEYGLVLLLLADCYEAAGKPELLRDIREEVRLVLKGYLDRNAVPDPDGLPPFDAGWPV